MNAAGILNRKLGIIVSLVLALVFTFLIVNTANKKFEQVSETVEVVRATQYIPAGETITTMNTEKVEVIESMANNLATPDQIKDKTALVSIIDGQLIHEDSLDTAKPLRSGHVEVFVPVDLSSSAYALAGHSVNVHIVDRETGTAPVVLKNIRVLHCFDNQAEAISEGNGNAIAKAAAGKNEPASVGLEVPIGDAEQIVHAASNKAVYLVKSKSGW